MAPGNESILEKKYLVYFVKSPYSHTDDDAWICAGAIISPTQILTAAACLVDMNMIYVIAGYKKYVHGRDIENDKCTKTWKKRVVNISVPKEYTISSSKQVEWINVDVGVATIHEPYDFDDQSYLTHCSYVPQSIRINYDKENEIEKTLVITLGWRGENVKNKSKENLKPQLLQEATTNIIDKTFCANLVAKNGSKEIVNKYLLCASGNGFLGEDGEEDYTFQYKNKDVDSEQKNINANRTNKIKPGKNNDVNSRKSPLIETCQTDHGSPLVTCVGTEEIILGVALNGICNPKFNCVGPRIYISTASTANIIKCLVETNETKRKICNDQIDDERYQVNNIEIKWPEELKNNTSSSSPLRIQQIASFRRNNEEKPIDRHGNQQDTLRVNSQEIPHVISKENLHMNHEANDSQLNPYYIEQQNRTQADQTKWSAEGRLDNQTDTIVQRSQQQVEWQYQPEIEIFNQPQVKLYNQPPLDSYYNQPSLDSYYNQPPLDSSYNQQPMNSYYNPPETESQNPPQTQLYNQPLAQFKNLKLTELYKQMNLFNGPYMPSQNEPQLPMSIDESKSNQPLPEINNNSPIFQSPQLESFMAPQLLSYNQPQMQLLKPRQTETFKQGKALGDIFRLSSFKESPISDALSNIPQADSFKDTEVQSEQLKAEFINPAQYSNEESTQSSYNFTQMESFKQEPTRPYNPLDVIMSENQTEDDSFKYPMEETNEQFNEEPPKQSSIDPYIAHPFNSYISQKYPLNSPDDVQLAPSDPSRVSNILRQREITSYPLESDSQTFERALSQLHASRSEFMTPAPVTTEETFEELYRKLHDGKFEIPHDQEFEIELFEKPIKGEVEQTDAKLTNEPPANVEPQNKVQVRQQRPLDYPDYT